MAVGVVALVALAVGIRDAYHLEVCTAQCSAQWGRTGPFIVRAGDPATSALVYAYRSTSNVLVVTTPSTIVSWNGGVGACPIVSSSGTETITQCVTGSGATLW